VQPTDIITLLRSTSDHQSKKLGERELPEVSLPSQDELSTAGRKTLIYPLVLVVLVFAVFANSLANGFVFDDTSMIENNTAIRDPKYLRAYFTSPFFSVGQAVRGPVPHDYYRPMILVSFLADYSLHGLSPRGWHVTNILLQCTVVVLLFFLFHRLKLGPDASFAAAALFAVHPAVADTVAGVSGRSDPLCAIFFLASLLCYISARQSKPAWSRVLLACSCFFFTVALLSKENAIVLPILLAAYEILCPETVGKRRPGFLIPFVTIAIVYVLWRSQVVPVSFAFSGGISELVLRLMTAAEIAISFLLVAVLPSDLGFEAFTPITASIADPRALTSTAAIFLCILAVAGLSKRFPRVCFFAGWFFICLAPFFYFLLFLPGPELFTPPHFLYFPLIGIAGLAGMGAARLAGAKGPGEKVLRRTVVFAAVGFIIILFGVQTLRRNTLWHDNFTFFSAMTRYAPRSPRVRIGMGNSFMKRDLPGYALSEYAAARELSRSEVDELFEGSDASHTEPVVGRITISNYYAAAALAGMGDAYRMLGENNNAIICYQEAGIENAFDAVIHVKLARAFEGAGHFDEAIESYERALRIDRRLSWAASSLEVAREKKRVYEKATRVYQMALQTGQTDSAESLYSEALIARLSGEELLAEALLGMAVEKDPLHFGANMALGKILCGRGDCGIALGNFGLAFAARPTSAQAAYKLATTNLAIRDTLAAEQWAAKAYDLAPDPYYWDFLQEIRGGTESGTPN
jgi:tetratricopeptide (TPR) repeat protein